MLYFKTILPYKLNLLDCYQVYQTELIKNPIGDGLWVYNNLPVEDNYIFFKLMDFNIISVYTW